MTEVADAAGVSQSLIADPKAVTTVIFRAAVSDKALGALRQALVSRQIDAVRIALAGDGRREASVDDKNGKKMMETFSCFYQSLDKKGIDLSAAVDPPAKTGQPASVGAKQAEPQKPTAQLTTDQMVTAKQPDDVVITTSQAQPQVLTNNDVIQMVKAKLPVSLIQSQIRSAKTNFDFSTAEVIRLSNEGVPEAVIAVMTNPRASVAGPSASSGKSLKTPDGEKVRLTLMEDISSATANEGDRVNLTVAEDVKVGDAVIIAKGATAAGTITETKKKGMLGRGGKLTMSMDQVKAVDGQNIRVRAKSSREGDDKTGKTVAIAVLAGPFALLVKGKDIAAAKGTEYAAYIDEAKDIAVLK